jgi:hypothetical protein
VGHQARDQMNTEFRLVSHMSYHSYMGVSTGETIRYALQVRHISSLGPGPWTTMPTVDFRELPKEEQLEIEQGQKG